MSLEYLLKSSRESTNLTQEAAAAKLEVSVNTISNWETGEATPSSRDWKNIGETYGISRDELLKALNDKMWPPDEEIPEDFPTCLFSDAGMEKIKKLVFTPQETELMRMLSVYNKNLKISEITEWGANEILNGLPGSYVERVGISVLQKMAHSIICKLSGDDEIYEAIEAELSDPEHGNTITAFNVFHSSPDFMYRLVKFGGREATECWINTYDTNIFSYDLIKAVSNVADGKKLVFDENDIVIGNNDFTQKFINDIDIVQKNPAILVKNKEFASNFSYLLQNIAKPILEDMGKCFKDGWLEIINGHCEFADLVSRNKFRESHFADYVLVGEANQHSPFPDWVVFSYEGEKGHRKCIASLTEKGRELYLFCQKHAYHALEDSIQESA